MVDFIRSTHFANIGVSLARSYTRAAMTTALAATSAAMAVPLAIANRAASQALTGALREEAVAEHESGPPALADEPAGVEEPSAEPVPAPVPFSRYRSDGGHATAQIIIGS